jgi:hypothetical protein
VFPEQWPDCDIGYFNSLSAALEVKARTRAVNDKITYAAEVQSVLRQLLHEVKYMSQCTAHDVNPNLF